MITKPTVLVLGAGASKPYDYPTGKELYDIVLTQLGQARDGVVSILQECSLEHQITPFRQALQFSGLESVDAFLEHRTEFIHIGKIMIAHILSCYERTEILFQASNPKTPENRWYKHLFGAMKTDHLGEFGQNNITFITFNYDRSLEQFLFTALKNIFDATDDECAQTLSAIPIIHPYGRIGWLPWQDGDYRCPYEMPQEDKRVLRAIEASKTIKIVHEQSDAGGIPAFIEARKALVKADTICFLGFGYHRANMTRLQLQGLKRNTHVYGTCLGQTDTERHSIQDFLQAIVKDTDSFILLDHEGHDTLSYLRNSPVIL